MKLQAIIFDVDGTLWNTTELVADAWQRAGEEYATKGVVTITGEQLRKEFGKPMDLIARNLFPEENASIQEKILKKCKKYEELILKETNQDLLYSHVWETLQSLSKKYKLFIVSNCQEGYIPLFLEKNKLQRYIIDFECYGATLQSKGDNIRNLMERNGIRRAVYVGDTIGDFEATKKAGIPFVYARYGFGNVDNAEYHVENISELPKIVEKLEKVNCDNA